VTIVVHNIQKVHNSELEVFYVAALYKFTFTYLFTYNNQTNSPINHTYVRHVISTL